MCVATLHDNYKSSLSLSQKSSLRNAKNTERAKRLLTVNIRNVKKKLIVGVIMDHIRNLGVGLELAVRQNIMNKRASVPSWL